MAVGVRGEGSGRGSAPRRSPVAHIPHAQRSKHVTRRIKCIRSRPRLRKRRNDGAAATGGIRRLLPADRIPAVRTADEGHNSGNERARREHRDSNNRLRNKQPGGVVRGAASPPRLGEDATPRRACRSCVSVVPKGFAYMDAVVVVGVMMRFAASQSTVTHGAHLNGTVRGHDSARVRLQSATIPARHAFRESMRYCPIKTRPCHGRGGT